MQRGDQEEERAVEADGCAEGLSLQVHPLLILAPRSSTEAER